MGRLRPRRFTVSARFARLSTAFATLVVAGLVLQQGTSGQTRFSYSTGQQLSPAYEGWWPNDDGTVTLFFGYMNTNWLQEFDIPVGPDNRFEPGPVDQGQPTHFYPRRNPFLFTIKSPKDMKGELVWTLTANGRTEKAFASLKTDYQIDKQVISTEIGGDNGSLSDTLRTNEPPDLRLVSEKKLAVKVGQPLSLVALAGDPDNIPARRDRRPQPNLRAMAGSTTEAPAPARPAAAAAAPTAAAVYRPPVAVVASSGPGLRLSWIVFRGNAANVTFNPDQMKTWMDTRAYANSAWSPPYTIPVPPADGRYTSQATFKEPGTYQLRAVASDGSLFTYDDVVVTVTR